MGICGTLLLLFLWIFVKSFSTSVPLFFFIQKPFFAVWNLQRRHIHFAFDTAHSMPIYKQLSLPLSINSVFFSSKCNKLPHSKHMRVCVMTQCIRIKLVLILFSADIHYFNIVRHVHLDGSLPFSPSFSWTIVGNLIIYYLIKKRIWLQIQIAAKNIKCCFIYYNVTCEFNFHGKCCILSKSFMLFVKWRAKKGDAFLSNTYDNHVMWYWTKHHTALALMTMSHALALSVIKCVSLTNNISFRCWANRKPFK